MKKRRKGEKFIAFLFGVFFFILVWWLLSYILLKEDLHYLPSPQSIFERVGIFLFREGAARTYSALGYSVLKLSIGFFISFVLAFVLGTLSALFPLFASFEKSHILLFRSIPTAAIALLLGTAFWLEVPSLQPFIPSILTFLVAFPILYQGFLDGILSLSPETKDALRLEGAERKIESVVFVYWPGAFNFIKLSLTQALGLSFKVTIMSEIVTNSGTLKAVGLGTLIGQSITVDADLNAALAYSMVAVLFVFVIDGILYFVKRPIEK